MEKIKFICEKCGEKVEITKYRYTINLCRKCKFNKTSLERYGVTNKRKLKDVIEKAKKTCLERYGVENPNQNKEIQEKIKQTNLERYGAKYTFQSEKIKEKIKQTNIERYGVENPNQNKEIQEKIKQTNLERYGKETFLGSFNKKEVTKKSNYDIFTKRISDDYLLINSFENYFNLDLTKEKLQIKCKKCGIEFQFLNNYGIERTPRCPECYPKSIGGSFEEDELFNFISSIYKGEILRNDKTFLNGLEIDIYIPKLNLGFEYNGLYYHSEISFNKGRYYHLNKQNMAKEKGIQLFFIQSNEWLNKKEIIKSIICSKFGVPQNKIFARKTELKEIDNKTANSFLDINHVQGKNNASINIGLFYNNELISITTFGKNRFGSKYEYELYRYCNKLNISVLGGFSKMLFYFEKRYSPISIITYSDKRLFNNKTYLKSGFTQLKDSLPNYYYTKNYNKVETRIKYQKYKLPDLLENFNPELTEWENMVINGYDRIWDCGNRVFVKIY